MKKLLTLFLFIILANPTSAKMLYEYGTFQERAEMASLIGIVEKTSEYTGSYEQNMALLAILEEEYKNHTGEALGGATGDADLPQVVANFETSLANKITSSETSMTLVSGTTDAGNTLSGWYGFTIDAGSSNQEYVVANCTGTACTSMLRGVSTDDGRTEVASLKSSHRRGASVKLTDHPNLTIITEILSGTDGIPAILYYDDVNTFTSQYQIVDKNYVDNLTNQGAATSSESVSGISELSTQAEMAASTDYGSDRPLVLQAKYATSTCSVAGNYIPVTGVNGTLDAVCIDKTDDYTWTGSTTISDLYYGGSQVTSSGAELNKLDGASANVTATNLNTMTAGTSSDASLLHTHTYYNDYNVGVGPDIDKSYWSFTLPFTISTNVPSGDFWTITNAAVQAYGGSFKVRGSGDTLNNIITTSGIYSASNISTEPMQFDDGKNVIVEFPLASDAQAEQQAWGLVESNVVFGDYDDQSIDAVCFTVDASGNLYAHTSNKGAGHTETAIPDISIASYATHVYRIEFDPGVSARFYVDGAIKVVITTNLPDGANNINFGFGAGGNQNNLTLISGEPAFAVEL